MRTKKLGWTDLHLTTLGLGTWAMGGGDWAYSWGPQDDAASTRAIYRALDLGVNWIDTAPAYGLGHAEEVVGRALKGMSQRPLIATKCGLVWDDQRQITARLHQESVRAEVDASLKRLGVDTIDLYQIHWPNPAEAIEEGWTAMAEAVRAGKVRYAGVSNFSVEQIQRVQSLHPVASLQPPYSLLAPGVEQELLPYCAAQQIGVVAYSPLQKGLLTGKITAERVAAWPPDDHRRRDPLFREPQLSANLELVARLARLAARHGRTVAQLALAWVLRRPEVTSAIVGSRSPAQIEETAGASEWELSPEDRTGIDDCLRAHQARLTQIAKTPRTSQRG
jgi:aryl-alcohol dehydrogenase-like predicted oxidoreductase